MRKFDFELFFQAIGLALLAGLASYGFGFLAVMSYGFGGFDLLTCLLGFSCAGFALCSAFMSFLAFE